MIYIIHPLNSCVACSCGSMASLFSFTIRSKSSPAFLKVKNATKCNLSYYLPINQSFNLQPPFVLINIFKNV